MPAVRYRPSDPWMLLALATSSFRDVSTLLDLVSAADFINHAVPERSEIEGGINRLAAAGLVSVSSHGFSLTPRSRRLLLGLEAKTRSLLKQWGLLLLKLAEVRLIDSPPKRWRLSRSRYERIVGENIRSFRLSG